MFQKKNKSLSSVKFHFIQFFFKKWIKKNQKMKFKIKIKKRKKDYNKNLNKKILLKYNITIIDYRIQNM